MSDAERDQAVAMLSEYFQVGRLTQEEFGDRSGRALQARTAGDLSVLFTDLPQHTAAVPAGRPAWPGSGRMRWAGGLPPARIVVVGVIAAVVLAGLLVLAGVLGGSYGHAGAGGIPPAVIVGFLFLRRLRRRR